MDQFIFNASLTSFNVSFLVDYLVLYNFSEGVSRVTLDLHIPLFLNHYCRYTEDMLP
jgi:hypothetical protein